MEICIRLKKGITVMSQYTEFLNIKAETLSPDDDFYEESLLEVSSRFRGFDEALTDFIMKHGYKEDATDVTAKAKFVREKFKDANIKPVHNFKALFLPNAKIKRPTAFQVCFAFRLSVEETNDFFRCVQFERGLDCHTINEAVYYFCMRNSFSYTEAKEIIGRITPPQKIKNISNREVRYTGTIIEDINEICDKEKFIEYITENIDDFQYNNITALSYIKELWTEIIGNENEKAEDKRLGLAAKEGAIIDYTYNRYEDKRKKKEYKHNSLLPHQKTDTRSAEVVAEEVREQEHNVKPDDYVIAVSTPSTWTVFSQIIGLTNHQENEYSTKHDRSLTSVLSENKLLPLKADYCFPSRQNIDKLIRGDLVADDEVVRKMLIFLVFYTYWAKKIINKKIKNALKYSAEPSDSERCLYTINSRLLDAGYPEIYAGNPYDWIFLWALNDDNPLHAFRYYMLEVFTIKDEQDNLDK